MVKRVIVVIALLLAAGLGMLWFSGQANAESARAATGFLKAVQSGNTGKAKRMFVDEKQKSLPREGYDAFFRLESGEEPNLAFLVNRPFGIGTARVTEHLPDSFCFTPLDCGAGEYVEVPLTFGKGQEPLLLPPELAMGGRMSAERFERYLQNPSSYREGLTLRLRHSLAPGLAKAPPPAVIPPPPGPRGQPASAVMIPASGMLGRPSPRDAGQVLLASGQTLTPEQLARKLPRLQSVTARFYLLREGQFTPWRIFSVEFKEAVVISGGRAHHW